MYTYTAGATGLSNAIPPRFHDGGPQKLLRAARGSGRARGDPRRDRAVATTAGRICTGRAGGAEGVLILATRKEENRQYQGKTLAQIAEMLRASIQIDALMELVAARPLAHRHGVLHDLRGERAPAGRAAVDGVRLRRRRRTAAEGAFLKRSTHPRAYGNFARLLGQVRARRADRAAAPRRSAG